MALTYNGTDHGPSACALMGLRQACDIRRVVTSTMDTFLALAVSRGLAYERSVDPALPPIVRTDGTRIQQILGNLLGSRRAIKDDNDVACPPPAACR